MQDDSELAGDGDEGVFAALGAGQTRPHAFSNYHLAERVRMMLVAA